MSIRSIKLFIDTRRDTIQRDSKSLMDVILSGPHSDSDKAFALGYMCYYKEPYFSQAMHQALLTLDIDSATAGLDTAIKTKPAYVLRPLAEPAAVHDILQHHQHQLALLALPAAVGALRTDTLTPLVTLGYVQTRNNSPDAIRGAREALGAHTENHKKPADLCQNLLDTMRHFNRFKYADARALETLCAQAAARVQDPAKRLTLARDMAVLIEARSSAKPPQLFNLYCATAASLYPDNIAPLLEESAHYKGFAHTFMFAAALRLAPNTARTSVQIVDALFTHGPKQKDIQALDRSLEQKLNRYLEENKVTAAQEFRILAYLWRTNPDQSRKVYGSATAQATALKEVFTRIADPGQKLTLAFEHLCALPAKALADIEPYASYVQTHMDQLPSPAAKAEVSLHLIRHFKAQGTDKANSCIAVLKDGLEELVPQLETPQDRARIAPLATRIVPYASLNWNLY